MQRAPAPSEEQLHEHPGVRVRHLAGLLGPEVVARWCAGLLTGAVAHDDAAYPALSWLGGPFATTLVEGGPLTDSPHAYWPRVWAARGLLYAWSSSVDAIVVGALGDEAWRVREMAAIVVRHREIGEAAEALAALLDDEVRRVRVAAMKALAVVGEVEQARRILSLTEDTDDVVRRTARRALAELERRLDHPLR